MKFSANQYDKIHQVWARAHSAGSPVKFVRNAVVFKHLAQLKPGNTLDVGCGMGEYSTFLAQLGHTITAFDPSAYAIEHFNEAVKVSEKIHVEVNTIEKFQAKRKFDNIISIEVFEHLENDTKAIGILYSMLRTNGELIISVPAMPFLYSESDRVSGHYRRYTKKRITQLISNVGFRDVRIYSYGFPILLFYMIMNKFILHRILIHAFSKETNNAKMKKFTRLAKLYPLLLKLDQLNLKTWSVGYVATCKK